MATAAVPTESATKRFSFGSVKESVGTWIQSSYETSKTAVNNSASYVSTKGKDFSQAAQPYITAAKPYAPVVLLAASAGAVTGLFLVKRKATA